MDRRRLSGRALEHAEQAQYQVNDQNGDDQAHNASRPTHSLYPLSPEHEGRRSRGQDQSYLLTGSSGAVSPSLSDLGGLDDGEAADEFPHQCLSSGGRPEWCLGQLAS